MLKSYPLSKQDSYAWALALVLPLLWVPFAIFFPKEIALGLYLVLSLVWTLLDRLSLMKQEKVPPSFWYFLLPMVYLRQRDERQGKPWRLLQVWVICTVLAVIAGEQFNKQSGTEQLAQSACSIVTQLMKQEGIDERCIRVTDLKEEVSGRFYRAQALMNTGNKEPMTIEVRGRDIYVVLPEMGE
ncbi:hypothetical protein [Yersinia intermedia]|uniref:hypothetical protein n=1 Tax=Yersinia intermedia TaxID=631 RepID=UPI0005DBE4ED|nr:hypothetical protein [Yersinia intermedia]CNE30985.1 Uncharacterised protein [Yersinia intermedia]